jgi:vanillate O-demethylase monooxygenase subunit
MAIVVIRSLTDLAGRALGLDVGATPTGTGAPEGRRIGGISMRNLNAITPETVASGAELTFDVNNADMSEKVFQQIRTAFLEDVAIFTAQQRSMTLHPNAPKVDINAVSGVIQTRRVVGRLNAEQQVAPARVMTAE